MCHMQAAHPTRWFWWFCSLKRRQGWAPCWLEFQCAEALTQPQVWRSTQELGAALWWHAEAAWCTQGMCGCCSGRGTGGAVLAPAGGLAAHASLSSVNVGPVAGWCRVFVLLSMWCPQLAPIMWQFTWVCHPAVTFGRVTWCNGCLLLLGVHPAGCGAGLLLSQLHTAVQWCGARVPTA